jgi:hypothetical protein
MSEAQTNANRENAQKSTGPRSGTGKANSSRNATTHGFTSTSTNPFLPSEEPQEFLDLRLDHYTRYQPVGPAEEKLIDRIAAAQWRLGRVFSHEAAILRDNFYNIEVKDRYRGNRYETRKAEAIQDGKPIPERPEVPGPDDLAGRAFNMDCAGPNAIAKLVRYETSLERSIDRSIRLLNAFQTARKAQEAREAAQQAAQENARKAAEEAAQQAARQAEDNAAEDAIFAAESPATPPNSTEYKTNPKYRPNRAPEAPSEPLVTFRSYPRASGDPVPPKSST